MLSFGGHFTGYNLLSYFARNLDNVLLGQLWGAAALGFYSRAYALVMQPLGQLVLPLTTVAVPTLSRLQGDPARFRAVYLRALRVVAYLTLPAAALGAVLADDLVLLVYGPGWERAAGIFQILALAAFWQPVASTAGWIHVARGRSDRMLRWSAVGSAAVVLSFAIGLPWGPEGVARSYAVCVWLLVIPQLGYALRGSGISSRALLDACVRPAAVALAVAASAAAARTLLDGTRPPFTLGGAAAAAAVVALAATLLLPGGRRELADLWALGRRLGAS